MNNQMTNPAVKLREFEVTFEDVGFTSLTLSGRELSESEAAAFTGTAVEENTLPDGVVAVVRGHIADDSEDEAGEKRVFVCVTLRVRAKDEGAAEEFAAPRALLATLADLMAMAVDGSNGLALEGNWEIADGAVEVIERPVLEADRKVPDTPVACPIKSRHPGDTVGCGSNNVTHADDEGFRDCQECGLFFKAPQVEVSDHKMAETQVNKAYRVHLYAVVRVPYDVPSAASQLDAIAKAEAQADLHRDFIQGEYAEEVVGVLVDEASDDEYFNTLNYVPDPESGDWVVEVQRTEAERHADAAGAKLFFMELLESGRTLTDIADLYGSRTLADLMLLQNAIASGGVTDHFAGESCLADLVKNTPSSDRWMKYVCVVESDGKPSAPSPHM